MITVYAAGLDAAGAQTANLQPLGGSLLDCSQSRLGFTMLIERRHNSVLRRLAGCVASLLLSREFLPVPLTR